MIAEGTGRQDNVDALLKAGADVNIKNSDGSMGACGGRGAEAPTDSAQRPLRQWRMALRKR